MRSRVFRRWSGRSRRLCRESYTHTTHTTSRCTECESEEKSSRSIVHMDRLLGFACSGLVEDVDFHVRSDELKIFLSFFVSSLVSVENSGS